MLLAGDDLPRLPRARLEWLKKLSPPAGRAAVFDSALRIGRLRESQRELAFFFNWSEQPEDFETAVPRSAQVTDFWSGAGVPSANGRVRVNGVPPHSARILVV